MSLTLDQILDALDANHQRATYGAVAAVLGKSPRTLMQGRDRDTRHSWVVNRVTGDPTGYDSTVLHPNLRERSEILRTREDLGAWLDSVSAVPTAS